MYPTVTGLKRHCNTDNSRNRFFYSKMLLPLKILMHTRTCVYSYYVIEVCKYVCLKQEPFAALYLCLNQHISGSHMLQSTKHTGICNNGNTIQTGYPFNYVTVYNCLCTLIVLFFVAHITYCLPLKVACIIHIHPHHVIILTLIGLTGYVCFPMSLYKKIPHHFAPIIL